MATSGTSLRLAINLNLCFLLVNLALIDALEGFPSREYVHSWAENFQSRVSQELDKFTGLKNLETKFDDLRKAKPTKVDGHSLVDRMAQDLSANLFVKTQALDRLVAAAEEVIKNYAFDPAVQLSEEEFLKLKDLRQNDSKLQYNEKFNKAVNTQYSGVHIPVEIYEKSLDIRNGLKWSSKLDTVFKKNAELDPDIMWQSFGSQSGFMRVYPASWWITLPRKPEFPDLYDVRLRPWYVHATSSPKDMLILMDLSGSMHGQTLEIMKIAVKTLLTTLGENDFVNIISFNTTAKWISCFDTLVQANRRNKQILSKSIDTVEDGNMAKLDVGLEFAFRAFEQFRENRTEMWAGSDCNQVIMLFSDGGTEEAWEVLDKYNSDKSIRVFAYAIGPHPVPYATLKEIACTNRGYFTSIQAMGAVRTKIQDYVKVLGRPLVLNSSKNYEWTNLYIDPLNLGMMTTVTLPIYNRTDDGNQTLAGVMGVDIALNRWIDFEPSYEIGPAGYSFGINHNGQVVFHPDLKTDFEYIEDPANLDFLDVEIKNPAKEELRNAMIDLKSSKRSLSSLLRMPDGKHIVRHHMEYFYTPLNETTFSIAIVMPTDRTHYLHIEDQDLEEGFNLKEKELLGMHLAPWKYCNNYVLKISTGEIIRNLSKTARNKPELCKMQLINRLVWDIFRTDDIMHYWRTEQKDKKRHSTKRWKSKHWKLYQKFHLTQNKVRGTFVQTEGGLTRIYPPSASDYLRDQFNPSRSLVFQRAFYGDDYVLLPPEPEYDVSANQTDAVVTIVKTISFARSGITYKPAVVGVMVDPLWLQPYLLSSGAGIPYSCDDIDNIVCYIIDDGAFIITTNQPDILNVMGKFLGTIDAEIMLELYEKKIYERNEDFNYEDRCKKEVKVSAGFRISPIPFHSTFAALDFAWVFDYAAWSYLKYWFLSLFSFWKLPRSEALPEFYELANETTCNTHEAQYYWGRWGRSNSGDIFCNNCTRHYSLAKVGQMNAVLIVSTKPCAPLYCDYVPPLLQAKEEVLNTENSSCDRPLRYRRRIDRCFSFSQDENSSECGAVGTLALPHLALLIELISLLLVTKLLYSEEGFLYAH
ncbi:voltage-dependent calcium channel subunit alpha-2/delta-1 isoform X2 [Parasteatoda tepidariorum]|uniref:voltage-dependent calcium channel subunit alpha-2/delta-1 isoform X2 n=1 Tax=Parasteatoda tepidariorum TaxID=114398 RepID=UPI001C71E1B8|nr:voltage-dependent calcium channel subunit alpha-2/delta-1 isoform X2 [Parasteatoda tepidariorum]